jgi:hypothetical protein
VPLSLLTIGALIARLARNKDNTWPPPWGWLEQHDGMIGRPTGGMLVLAALSLLVWVPILPLTQPEQQNRRAFERAARRGDYTAAAAALDRPQEEFPPGWGPPIQLRYQVPAFHDLVLGPSKVSTPVVQIVMMLVALHEQGGPAWAVELYEARLSRILEEENLHNEREIQVLSDQLPRFPFGVALLKEARKLPAKDDDDLEDAKERRRYNLRVILTWPKKARKEVADDEEK